MRGAREKLHFMDFKQRIPVAAASLNVSSGCEEIGGTGKYRNIKKQKYKAKV